MDATHYTNKLTISYRIGIFQFWLIFCLRFFSEIFYELLVYGVALNGAALRVLLFFLFRDSLKRSILHYAYELHTWKVL